MYFFYTETSFIGLWHLEAVAGRIVHGNSQIDSREERLMQNEALDLKNLTDEELVLMSQAGQQAAFSELVERHYRSAVRLAATILRNRDDAEDEVQNAFSKAFEHIGQFQMGCRFSTWLTRIVVNQCLMRIRQLRRSKVTSMDEPVFADEMSKSLEVADPGRGPDRTLAESEIRGVLEQEIRCIPPLLRHAFILRHMEELPMAEVARRLGISVAAAKSRLLRARLELQERLQKHQSRLGPVSLVA